MWDKNLEKKFKKALAKSRSLIDEIGEKELRTRLNALLTTAYNEIEASNIDEDNLSVVGSMVKAKAAGLYNRMENYNEELRLFQTQATITRTRNS